MILTPSGHVDVRLFEEGQVLMRRSYCGHIMTCNGWPTASSGWSDLTLLCTSERIQNSLKNLAKMSFLAMKDSVLCSVAHRVQLLCQRPRASVPIR
jgi:hypothetical protein